MLDSRLAGEALLLLHYMIVLEKAGGNPSFARACGKQPHRISPGIKN